MKLCKRLRAGACDGKRLHAISADSTWGVEDKEGSLPLLEANLEALRRYQYTLYAENKRALLVVLQGMDASGKDGVVRHVFGPLNPQGCKVTSFKAPTAAELGRDFLWRIHQAVPACGEIGIFNRSHYEDVLIARVRGLVPERVWKARYEMINAFERHLADNGMVIVKCFLHISRKEQTERLLARLDDPDRNWKFALSDIEERAYWDDYHAAYEAAFKRCDTGHAPWYIIPADRKWYRNWAVSQILVETLTAMDLRFPEPREDAALLKRRLIAAARADGSLE